ncbi:hypothetical protein EJ06DRAFT_339085 [Trichodelitschia bisporula]|uniref:Uncharacterized protein n=1 Tax=Trichodelitschia bisporula TaxID=703511 RepID=A0A6G1I2Z1_9PEZI|nr:hypothetical protein EJ06DRAFT_339085 [Trichodelitschia bisporula]
MANINCLKYSINKPWYASAVMPNTETRKTHPFILDQMLELSSEPLSNHSDAGSWGVSSEGEREHKGESDPEGKGYEAERNEVGERDEEGERDE